MRIQMKQELSNSNGFKSLKIRNSHSGRPASALQQIQDFSIIPFEMSEQAFHSSLKLEINNIEQEIHSIKQMNLFQQKQFIQPYMIKVKQYINSIKQQEFQNDSSKIMSICQTLDPNETIIKLYNMIITLENYLNKVTEMECLHFLQYESYFKDFQSPYLQKLTSSGIIPNRLIMSLLNLEKIEYLIQLNSKNKPQESTKIQIYQEDSMEKQKLYNQQIQIEQLKEQLKEYQNSNQQLKMASSIQQQQQQQQQQIQPQPQPQAQDPEFYCKLIDEVKESYENLIHLLREENQTNNLKLIEMSNKFDILKAELHESQTKIQQLKQIKDDLYKRLGGKYQTTQEYADSYEAALHAEYQAMQQSYDARLNKIQGEMENQQKELQKKICEMKQQIDYLTDRERLLIKKLSAYMKV